MKRKIEEEKSKIIFSFEQPAEEGMREATAMSQKEKHKNTELEQEASPSTQ